MGVIARGLLVVRPYLAPPPTARFISSQGGSGYLAGESRIRRALNLLRGVLFRHVRVNRTPTAVDGLRHGKTLSRLRHIPQPYRRWPSIFKTDPGSPVASWARLVSRRMIFGSGSLALVGLSVQADGTAFMSPENKMDLLFEDIRRNFTSKWLNYFPSPITLDSPSLSVDSFNFGSCISKGCNAVVYEASLDGQEHKPFAIKMMFNYDAETKADAVFQAMEKECIIFPGSFGTDVKSFGNQSLKPHPCIAEVSGVFVDYTPLLPEALTLYPNALPRRFHEAGYGRNMTMFLVMKKYDMSLRDYLLQVELINLDNSLKILGQMFEAVSFLVDNKVVHRDIKSDNFLVDISRGLNEPRVVLSDFGCCFTNLFMYFPSRETSKGGNRALMPPEVVISEPGLLSFIDYSAADLWSVGTLAYEVFRVPNPFYGSPCQPRLHSSTYHETDLPKLPSWVSLPILLLVRGILKRDPSERPSARVAATVCHIALSLKYLSKKMTRRRRSPTAEDLVNVLSQLMLLEALDSASAVVNELRLLFLTQVTASDLDQALNYFFIK